MNIKDIVEILGNIWTVLVAIVGCVVYKFIPYVRTKISINKNYNINTIFWLIEYELIGTFIGNLVRLLCSINFSKSTWEYVVFEKNEWWGIVIVLPYLLGISLIVKFKTERKPRKYLSNIFCGGMIFVVLAVQFLLMLEDKYEEKDGFIFYLIVFLFGLLQFKINVKTDRVKSIKYKVITKEEEYNTLCEPIKRGKFYFIKMIDEKTNEVKMIQLSEDKLEKIEYEIEDLKEMLKAEDRGRVSNKNMHSLKGEWIKFRYSVSFICVALILVSTLFFVICYFFFEKGSVMYEVAFALFTGIIASTVVTLIVDIKQKREMDEKKKALLFDAVFELATYAEEYKKFHDNPPLEFDMKIKRLYSICTKPIEHILDLYKYNSEIFDVVEIIFIRKINSTYNFFNRLFESELSDDVIKEYFHAGFSEDSKGMQKHWEMLNTLNENLFYLKIKWEKDKVV